MILAKALVILNTEVWSVAIVKSHSSSVMFRTPAFFADPAQLTKISTFPNSFSAAAAAFPHPRGPRRYHPAPAPAAGRSAADRVLCCSDTGTR